MTLKNSFFICIVSFLLTSCVIDNYKEAHLSSQDKKNIQLYYYSPPQCNYEIIGYIEINGFIYSKESVFQHMVDKAAEMGAEGVVVDYLERLDSREYVGIAKAIRCYKAPAKMKEKVF